jgi:hypothetical protein
MHLRLVVGGLLVRHPVLSSLLLNYADRLDRGCAGPDTATTCFIVPSWTADDCSDGPGRSELLTVQVHTARGIPGRRECAEEVWHLVQSALTDGPAADQVRIRCLATSQELVDVSLDTAFSARTWRVAAVLPGHTGASPSPVGAVAGVQSTGHRQFRHAGRRRGLDGLGAVPTPVSHGPDILGP